MKSSEITKPKWTRGIILIFFKTILSSFLGLLDKLRVIITGLNNNLTINNVIKNVFWAVTGKVVVLLSTFIVGIFVARYLGPEQYGLMNYIISIVALFGVLTNFGTTEIIIRELAKKEFPIHSILGTSFFLRIGFALITVCAIAAYLLFSKENATTSFLIIIYSFGLFFYSFDIIRHYFTSIIQNKFVVKSEIFRSLVSVVIKIILLWMKAPLLFFVIALTIDFALLAGGYMVVYKKNVGNMCNWRFDKRYAVFLLKTSFPLLISNAALVIYQRIDQVMINKMLDNESLGYFSTAASFMGVVVFIPTIMIQTLAPILVRYKNDDPFRYKMESQRMMNVTTWLTIIICIFISAFSYFLIRYTYGIEYLAAVPTMKILTFKAVGIALTLLGGQLIIIENIHHVVYIQNILACLVCFICNYFFIPIWGIVGSAWATIITVMFTGGISNIFIPRYHHIFKKQCIALFFGWNDLLKIKQLIKL